MSCVNFESKFESILKAVVESITRKIFLVEIYTWGSKYLNYKFLAMWLSFSYFYFKMLFFTMYKISHFCKKCNFF